MANTLLKVTTLLLVSIAFAPVSHAAGNTPAGTSKATSSQPQPKPTTKIIGHDSGKRFEVLRSHNGTGKAQIRPLPYQGPKVEKALTKMRTG
jgi:curli biogenesis system outer membrane secretion channel CsgG